ncbi:hypothetical protein HDU93_004614, partial [Gonapodya sp. JEL0774]
MSHKPHSKLHHVATASHIRTSIPSYVTEIKSIASALESAAMSVESGPRLADKLRTRARGIREAVEANREFLLGLADALDNGSVFYGSSVDGLLDSLRNGDPEKNTRQQLPISVVLPLPDGITLPPYKFGSYDSPHTLMGHLARDWTDEGYSNTRRTYDIVRDMMRKYVPADSIRIDFTSSAGISRGSPRVLLPGGGLSRLAFDLALEGYDAECNELSPLMATVSATILSRTYSSESSGHSISNPSAESPRNRSAHIPRIYPHLHRNKNLFHGDSQDQLTPQLCPFPSPSAVLTSHLASGKSYIPVRISVGGYSHLYADENTDDAPDPDDQGFDGCPKCIAARDRRRAAAAAAKSKSASGPLSASAVPSITPPRAQFDAVVASFFVDRAHSNPLVLLRHLLVPLRPGGLLIVLGPLAWRNDAKPSLTWDEIKCWWEENGVQMLEESVVKADYAREEGKM